MQQTKRVPSWTNPINAIVPKFAYAGTHVVADFWNGKVIEDKKELEQLLLGAAKAANSKPLQISIYKFAPQGITGVVLLAESHIALHTWPEINYIAIDIFTCGMEARPKDALSYFEKHLHPERVEVTEMKRGRQP
ncbi:adenosylmethionine decarboxylase [Patescibacteria group bacterium]|nr:adenosylmethionine decarboxylase [Patescibacteria group bacterium]